MITGALGHLGSRLVVDIQREIPHTNLILIDNMSTQRYGVFPAFRKGFEFIETDLRNSNIKKAMQNSQLIIHLGAITDASGTANTPKIVFDNNLNTTINIADICSNEQIPLIFPSTTSVYGSQINRVDEESTQLNPQSPYAECKLLEEEVISKMGTLGTIFRLGTIHGTSPGMRFHTAVNKFCWQAAWSQEISIWETALDQVRPYLAVQDFSNCILGIINSEKRYGGETINLVSENKTPRDIVNHLSSICDVKVKYVKDPIMNQLSYEVSNLKAQRLGIEFSNRLEDNIRATIDFLRRDQFIEEH